MISDVFRERVCNAVYCRITDFLVDICDGIIVDCEQSNRKLPNDENIIRNVMIEDYIKKWKFSKRMADFRFESENPEHYDGKGKYIGRVDIRILWKGDFAKDDAYFIVECKRIDGTAYLNKEYIKEGICRFVNKKYSSYYGRNIMLGFVVNKIDISGNVRLIDDMQSSYLDSNSFEPFVLIRKTSGTELYRNNYHINTGALELCHLFSDYSSIVR